MLKKLYHLLGTQIHRPYADAWLALCSFLESLILPPVAPLLVLFCLENKKKIWWYVSLATWCSVAGGIVAYMLGFFCWNAAGQQLMHFITSPEKFSYLTELYHRHQSLAVLLGSFLPVPYKAIGLSAGFCKLPLMPFVIFSSLGRTARYYALGGLLWFWGISLKLFIDRWFYYLVGLFMAALGIGLLVIMNV
jgi:membrane protein YqaA with SNARE-associated domain